MRLTQKGNLALLLTLVSAFFAYLIVIPYHFPRLGLSLSFLILAVIAYQLKKEKNKNTKYLLIFTILFSSFIFIRSEEFLIFLNVWAALYFGSLMMLSSNREKLTALKVTTAPFWLIFKGLTGKNIYSLEFKEKPSFDTKKVNLSEIILTVLISIFILLIVPPILASANPIFADKLENLYQIFNLQSWVDYLVSISGSTLLLRTFFFIVLIILLPRMLTYMNTKDKNYLKALKLKFNLNLILPKLILVLILLLFFITQFQLYFASRETLSQMGLTYSEYANEVFAQLSVVSLIIIWLIYIESIGSKNSRYLTYFLITQGIFLTIMAFKSDFEYSSTFGFTYKRLYGFAVVAFILGIFLLQFFTIYKKLNKNWFVKNSIYYFGLILFLVNLINFDYLIYHYRKSITGQGVDYQYLSRLSTDSLSYKDQFDELIHLNSLPENRYNHRIFSPGNTILWKIESLQNKYNEVNLRSFGLLEYLQYRQIKDIDVQQYQSEFKPNLAPPIESNYYP